MFRLHSCAVKKSTNPCDLRGEVQSAVIALGRRVPLVSRFPATTTTTITCKLARVPSIPSHFQMVYAGADWTL
jgi:hypothetical protein